MKKMFVILLGLITVLALTVSAFAESELTFDPDKDPASYSGTVTLYSPQDSDPLNAVINMFEEKYPNVTVTVVSDGAGALMARLDAEKENPQADVVWTISNDILANYADCLQPYKPTCYEYFTEDLCGPDYLFIGDAPMLRVFIYNTDLIPEDEVPQSWTDLTKWDVDKYGYIALADPNTSSGALAILNTILMALGTKENDYEEAWDTIAEIIPKLSIQSSSSGPYKNVVSGEYALGITGERQSVMFSDPIKHLYPSDGTSVVTSGIAIVKDCPDPELAVLFEEFALSKEVATVLADEYYFRPTRSDVTSESMPALSSLTTVNYDSAWAAEHNDATKEKWQELIVEYGN